MSSKFSAKEALKMSANSGNIRESEQEIFDSIKKVALKGLRTLQVYKNYPQEVLEILDKEGFSIKFHDSLAIQKDDLYYTIEW